MQIALMASGSYDTLFTAARWAEDRGLPVLGIPDHYVFSLDESGIANPAHDAFALLAGLARETSTIRLSVTVSPITFRHPAVLAKTAFTIDAMSAGRFTLGIGTGWLDLEHETFGFRYPPMTERYEMMEEGLAYVRAMAAGEAFDGEYYALQAADLHPRPSDGFQIVVGGKGPLKTPTLAGRYADEYNAFPAPIEEFRARVDLARSEAAAAGRDPDALVISSAGSVLVGADEADYRDRLAAAAAEAGITTGELEAHYDARNTPRGPIDRVREQLAALERAGMSLFYFQTPWSDDLDRTGEVIDLLGE